MKNILTADIGATNSRFAGFSVKESGALELSRTWWFRTQDFKSFKGMMAKVKGIPLDFSKVDIAVILLYPGISMLPMRKRILA
jgi:glucokinase